VNVDPGLEHAQAQTGQAHAGSSVIDRLHGDSVCCMRHAHSLPSHSIGLTFLLFTCAA
jgi:hypothetical protein